MKRFIRNLSIRQSILISTLCIVSIVLLVTSATYSYVFSVRADALVERQSRELNKQIVLNYENYINSVIETANSIQAASLNLDVAREYGRLQEVYRFNAEIKKDVVAVILLRDSGELVLGSETDIGPVGRIDEIWFRSALQKREIFYFSAPHMNSITSQRKEEVISVSKAVEYTENGVKKVGVLLIELNFRTIGGLADKMNLGAGGHILIVNDDDSIVYSSLPQYGRIPSESMAITRQRYFGGFKATINHSEMYVNINTLSHTRWRIVSVTNIDDIARTKQQMVALSIVIFLLSLAGAAFVDYLISVRISRPLNQLQETITSIESGNFLTKAKASGQKEVVLLAKSFNKMIDEIRSLMDRVVAEQRDKRKTELRALQNQINPHFLYNTLDSIVWLAENQRTRDVITTVVALARFFRISISKGEIFIPVRDEIEHISNYLTIQKIRYINRFEYVIDIDEGMLDEKVMKLMLQPIVENAIYHGIGDESEVITIRGYRDGDFLVFEVENTGYGLTEEKIREIYAGLTGDGNTGVGIRNVYQRLKIYYGDEADIRVRSVLDEKTTVSLLIPLEARTEREWKK